MSEAKRPLFSRAGSLVARFRRNESGSIVTMFAVMLPVLIAGVGLGVESGQWYANKREMQTAADAAAISGALERAHGQPSRVTASALTDAVRNGYVNTSPNTITINNPPASGSYVGEQSAVEVIVQDHPTPLLASIVMQNLTVTARSVAQVQVTGQACVLALDPSSSSAISNSGNPTLNLTGCDIASNSTSNSSINFTGSADLIANSLYTAGNYTAGTSTTVNLSQTPLIHEFALDDPYANVDIPPISGCDATSASYTTTTTINPGVYCNGLSVQTTGHITMNPGTYYINQGNFNVASGATITCNCTGTQGVTIVMTSTGDAADIGTVTINGGANVTLNAPTDGSNFSGILFYQDRRATLGLIDKFTGGSNQTLTGAIYFPKQIIQYAGDVNSPSCTQIIGYQVVFTGNTGIDDSGCSGSGIHPLDITGVKIVE